MNSEKCYSFDKSREEFKPYGLTCETWIPSIMPRCDKHNEIEINYLPQGNITYLRHNEKITIPNKRFTIFWGLVPHQIIRYENVDRYYVCTIPLARFLSWNLPVQFVDNLLKGDILYEKTNDYSQYDEFLLNNWLKDNDAGIQSSLIILLEMQARIIRMAHHLESSDDGIALASYQTTLIEKITIYLTKNYCNNIKANDIGEAVGLHPDYANYIFKKAFGTTITDYIAELRIAHAQRKLLTTDMSITDIAYECGFNTIARFNATFFKKIRCTPREYKKLMK
ncbi:helix-turn-helix domain-containing protein [Bacteroides sp. AM10-21B]|uniref:helix-turn-helix domain-containing protein n=1 Tax=Bacteroides sp. AM10-21B TaxID=2292001 RepID=UPI000E4EABDC|nr:helix-turn-helix domain-containing protein [Bacteroides sp. AM10-21B]RHJ54984.1 helix-turn-helix domain-containing protein [Bacteroides sp. AM10-21B]